MPQKTPLTRSGWIKKALIISVSIVLLLILLGQVKKRREPVSEIAGASVPQRFSSLYRDLESELDTFSQTIPDGNSHVLYGAELLTANSHRGEDLLHEHGMEGNIVMLDRLATLGVDGVSVSLNYPILLSSYPRSDEYWEFYQGLIAEIRSRHMTVLMDIGPIFQNNAFGSVKFSYRDISKEEYLHGKKEIAVRAARELQPDYLTVVTEPSSEKANTGFDISVDDYNRFITDVSNQAGDTSVLIGAGIGTWEDASYITSFAHNPAVDVIDVHIYPISNGRKSYLEEAVSMTKTARENGKKVIIGEFWLYKASPADLIRGAAQADIFARDSYSFFAPLDQKMLETVSHMAQAYGIEYISPFWSNYFFAYLPYEGNQTRSSSRLMKDAQKQAAEAMVNNGTSETGQFYKTLTAP